MNTILNIKEPLEEDESIVNFQYYHFSPETGSQLNTPGNITITVQNSDSFFHPSASWLEFEGQVRATDESLYTGTSLISFVNCGISFLIKLNAYCLDPRLKQCFNLELWPTF